MATHQLSAPDINFTDKRRSSRADEDSHIVGPVLFTANAGGSTTTIVGANATSGGANTIRVGEKVKVFNSDGTVQEEKVLTVTTVTIGASTTVTFTPALTAATASGDVLRAVGNPLSYADNDSLDARLNAINGTLYSQANLDKMTQNDKVYALRLNDDPTSF